MRSEGKFDTDGGWVGAVSTVRRSTAAKYTPPARSTVHQSIDSSRWLTHCRPPLIRRPRALHSTPGDEPRQIVKLS
eukprot:scaffold123179_cov75-Phaeocystis_antarctica.AAC.2